MIRAVTLDFGNTLVPVPASALREVVAVTARAIARDLGPFADEDVLRTWHEERERQLREEIPALREVDLDQRLVRILARLRGLPAPPADVRWDDEDAARRSEPAERAWAADIYSRTFVERLPPAGDADELLDALAARWPVGILSNWPLATTIDRYAEAWGWSGHLAAIVVSQRVGTIKPHPAIFAAAREALGGPPGRAILHVGDDWAADVVGAVGAGWRAGYLAARPADSPLPGSTRDASVVADVVIDRLAELLPALEALDRGEPR
jgi:FMN phosphatase YigB (HAD superfamily)